MMVALALCIARSGDALIIAAHLFDGRFSISFLEAALVCAAGESVGRIRAYLTDQLNAMLEFGVLITKQKCANQTR
jgi:hypothetical protein